MGENLVLFGLSLLTFSSAALLISVIRNVRRSGQSARRSCIILINALVLICLTGWVLTAGEIYYRFFYDTTDSLLCTKISQRWLTHYWHRNSAGLRDDINYSPIISPQKVRISFVGDSFTAGHGVKDIKARFVNRVRAAHPDWEVHMLAMPGFDTGDEIDFLRTCLGNGYQINEVVLVYCLNDVSDMMQQRYDGINRINQDVEQSGWLRRNSYFFNTMYYRVQMRIDPFMKNYFSFVKEAYHGPLWELQKERLCKFKGLVGDHGGRLSVIIFPFLQAVDKDYEYEFAHNELNQFWQDLNVPHLDLLPVFRGIPAHELTVNRFDAHPNERAHDLAAKAIDNFLTHLPPREARPSVKRQSRAPLSTR